LLAELRFGERVRLALNVGARARRDTAVQGLTVGSELTGGAGLTVVLVPERLDLVAEIYGATAFDDAFARGNTPFEVLGGVRGRPVCALSLGLAAGTGITRGYGSPDVRGVFQAGVTTEACEAPVAPVPVAAAPRDSDDDGLVDPLDACPTDAEDMDGFADEDGCPDPDNDEDQVPDERDGAPNDPEDRDGFEDEDGVPELDNDADGVPDVRDGAPNEPEDRDGFLDEDGVPDPDNDGDGVLDAEDRCPLDPGPPTAQGCPVNIRVDRESGLIIILQRVEFETNGDVLLAPSIPVLDEVRAVLAANPNLDHLRVEGHTDDRGRDATNLELSRRRAATVVGWLVGRGIARARLESWGCGELHPTESNRTPRGRQSNRRVEFHIMAGATPSEQLRRLVGCVETP
jgi:outer membrane protein OmpA-like peptidoglycan-associated protein